MHGQRTRANGATREISDNSVYIEFGETMDVDVHIHPSMLCFAKPRSDLERYVGRYCVFPRTRDLGLLIYFCMCYGRDAGVCVWCAFVASLYPDQKKLDDAKLITG